MQILTKLTKVFGNDHGIVLRLAHLSTRRTPAELADALRRELYGMGRREQVAARQVISRAGQVVTVRQDTVATGKKSRPCYLKKGSQMKISTTSPLRIDPAGDAQVNVLDQSNKYLTIKLSDYIRDIYVSDQG
jgi:hypothetical protein